MSDVPISNVAFYPPFLLSNCEDIFLLVYLSSVLYLVLAAVLSLLNLSAVC